MVISKTESAKLILKLYDLRREEKMREARTWMGTFNPTSEKDFEDVVKGPNSAYYRMVTSYWEMAASLVNNGAIDAKMFNDANGEHMFVFAKIQPFLVNLRKKTAGIYVPFEHLEKLCMSQPNAVKKLQAIRDMMTKR